MSWGEFFFVMLMGGPIWVIIYLAGMGCTENGRRRIREKWHRWRGKRKRRKRGPYDLEI